jgi:hypothetical protein
MSNKRARTHEPAAAVLLEVTTTTPGADTVNQRLPLAANVGEVKKGLERERGIDTQDMSLFLTDGSRSEQLLDSQNLNQLKYDSQNMTLSLTLVVHDHVQMELFTAIGLVHGQTDCGNDYVNTFSIGAFRSYAEAKSAYQRYIEEHKLKYASCDGSDDDDADDIAAYQEVGWEFFNMRGNTLRGEGGYVRNDGGNEQVIQFVIEQSKMTMPAEAQAGIMEMHTPS